MTPGRTAKFYWLRLVRLQGSPFLLARGVAVGIFVGLTPTIPLHSILTVAMATAMRGNIVAAFLASFLVSNPLTIPVHYYLAWKIGSLLFPDPVTWTEVTALIEKAGSMSLIDATRYVFIESFRLMKILLVGGFILAAPLAIAGYFASLYLYYRRQKARQLRFLQRYGGGKEEGR